MSGRPVRPRGWIPAAGLALAALATGCATDVRIGCVVSSSGAAAHFGEKVRKGIDLALETETEAGTLPGKVALFYRDDATHPETGRLAVEELIDRERVPFVIGAVSSTVTLAIAPVCEEREVVLLSPTGSAAEITTAGSFVFRNHPSDTLEAVSMAEFARDLGIGRIAAIAVDDGFGEALTAAFRGKLAENDNEPVAIVSFREGNAREIGAAARAVATLDPQAVYVVAYSADTAAVVRELRLAGARGIVLATSSLTPDFPSTAGDAAEGVVFPRAAFDARDPEPAVRDFVERYRARYGEEPDDYAAHGYDALRLALRAFRDAPSRKPRALRDALAAVSGFSGAAGHTAFDENGDVLRHPRLFVVRSREAVRYDRFVAEGGRLPVPEP